MGKFPAERLDHDFLARYGVDQGIFIPLLGASGKGRIVLTGICLQSVEQLQLAKAVGAEIEHFFDSVGFHRASEQLALLRLRQTVARDLHDSVAQSIAGVRYWLQSLKSGLANNESASNQVDAIAATLAEEQEVIRAMIERLRAGDFGDGEVDLIEQMNEAIGSLARLWRTSIEIVAD